MSIVVDSRILSLAEELPDDQRELIEAAKARRQVDDVIHSAYATHQARMAGLAALLDEEQRTERLREITDKLDIQIALLALCKDIDGIEQIKKLATLSGRQHKPPVKVDAQDLLPRLRAVFEEIGKEYGLHRVGVDDRALIRRKAKAAVKIINEALANGRTR